MYKQVLATSELVTSFISCSKLAHKVYLLSALLLLFENLFFKPFHKSSFYKPFKPKPIKLFKILSLSIPCLAIPNKNIWVKYTTLKVWIHDIKCAI